MPVSTAPLRVQRFSGQTASAIRCGAGQCESRTGKRRRAARPALRNGHGAAFRARLFQGPRPFRRRCSAIGARGECLCLHGGTPHCVWGRSSRPGDTAGRHLLAHELTHVLQQGGRCPRLQRKEKESPPSWQLVKAAERLSMASPVLYQLDPLLEVIEPKSKISALLTRHALETKVAHPMRGSPEKIETPFLVTSAACGAPSRNSRGYWLPICGLVPTYFSMRPKRRWKTRAGALWGRGQTH